MTRELDRAAADPARQATTARERSQRVSEDAAASAAHARAAAIVAAERATRAADAAHRARIERLRADFLEAHPGSSDADFERALPDLTSG